MNRLVLVTDSLLYRPGDPVTGYDSIRSKDFIPFLDMRRFVCLSDDLCDFHGENGKAHGYYFSDKYDFCIINCINIIHADLSKIICY